jgi:hypothetical protein
MAFSLQGALTGLAKGGSAVLDSRKAEYNTEKTKVSNDIATGMNTMYTNALQVDDDRKKTKKEDTAYMRLLATKAPGIIDNPEEQAFILSLGTEGRTDLMNLVESVTFREANKPLAEYFTAITDPVEFKDPITLTERVYGRVVDVPLKPQDYYPSTDMSDAAVDKILARQESIFATATGMSAARANGLLQSSKKEIKMQEFSINWANKNLISNQEEVTRIENHAILQQSLKNGSLVLTQNLEKTYKSTLTEHEAKWYRDNSLTMVAGDINAADSARKRYLKSNAYKAKRENIITTLGESIFMTPSLEDSHARYINNTFGDYWGGNLPTAEEIKDDPSIVEKHKYYVAEFGNGVGVSQGNSILESMGLLEIDSKERTPDEIVKAESELQQSQLNMDTPSKAAVKIQVELAKAKEKEESGTPEEVKEERLEAQKKDPTVQSSIDAVSDLTGATSKVRSQQEDVSWFDSLTTYPTDPEDINRMDRALEYLLRKRRNGEYYRSASDIQSILDKVKSLRSGSSSLMRKTTKKKSRSNTGA